MVGTRSPAERPPPPRFGEGPPVHVLSMFSVYVLCWRVIIHDCKGNMNNE